LYGPNHIQVWLFVKERWSDLVKIWRGNSYNALNKLLRRLVSLFTEISAIEEAENLFIKGKGGPDWFVPPLADRSVAKGLEIARTRVDWLSRNRLEIHEWLRKEITLFK
jgi:hypothetical protein